MNAPIRIIVIDDEVSMTKLLKLVLEDHLDCEVETHNDPRQALKRLNTQEFDVISLDQRMPGMNGAEIVRALRTSNGPNARTPILIFTGFREEAEGLTADMLTNVLFLEKPIDDERYVQHMKIAYAMKTKTRAAA